MGDWGDVPPSRVCPFLILGILECNLLVSALYWAAPFLLIVLLHFPSCGLTLCISVFCSYVFARLLCSSGTQSPSYLLFEPANSGLHPLLGFSYVVMKVAWGLIVLTSGGGSWSGLLVLVLVVPNRAWSDCLGYVGCWALGFPSIPLLLGPVSVVKNCCLWWVLCCLRTIFLCATYRYNMRYGAALTIAKARRIAHCPTRLNLRSRRSSLCFLVWTWS